MRVSRTLEVVGKTRQVATALSRLSEKIPTAMGLGMPAKLGKKEKALVAISLINLLRS